VLDHEDEDDNVEEAADCATGTGGNELSGVVHAAS